MSFFDELDSAPVTDDDLTNFAKGNNPQPPGKYHVTLDGARETTAKESGNTGTELHFKIVAAKNPDDIGYEIKETLWHTGKDDAATKKMQQRAILFGAKLGLLVKNARGTYQKAEGKSDFTDCLGSECVIEVGHEKYTSAKSGKPGVACRMSWGGIYGLADKEAKGVIVAKSEPAKAGAALAKPTGGKKKFDPSEL